MSSDDKNVVMRKKSIIRSSVRMGVNSLKNNTIRKSYLETQISSPVMRRVKKLSLGDLRLFTGDKDDFEFRKRSESYLIAVNHTSSLQNRSKNSPILRRSKRVSIAQFCERDLTHSTPIKNLKTSKTEFKDLGIITYKRITKT